MPAPSPMTKPSRSLSNGRDAPCGSSLRVDSARMALKPPTPSGVTVASVPPQIMASASPRSMTRKASPMACAPVEQADTCDRLGPLAPKRIERFPDARFTMIIGTKNGEKPCRGPFSHSVLQVASMVVTPPRPAPTKQPTRSANSPEISRPESATASEPAATAYCTNGSSVFASRAVIQRLESKPFTSPAKCVAKAA